MNVKGRCPACGKRLRDNWGCGIKDIHIESGIEYHLDCCQNQKKSMEACTSEISRLKAWSGSQSLELSIVSGNHKTEGESFDKWLFEVLLTRVKAFIKEGDRPHYWEGYQHGLTRRYYGVDVNTAREHEIWTVLPQSADPIWAERGEGYKDGYIPDFCTQNQGNCRTCSLGNGDLDCQGKSIVKLGED
jgi:hypothetical protein